jgi:peptidoglycan/xylan/chitin deacetylase (PgdA/CDA1 family)
MKPKRLSAIVVVAVLGAALLAGGCVLAGKHAGESVAAPTPTPTAPAPLPTLDLAAVHPNEAGEVPVLEYHELVPDGVRPHGYEYPIGRFRQDMERLYALGYRPINLSELATGHIDCPAGRSPVVITFDDALPGQLDFDANGEIDPNCAVGVLQQMHAEHPDWPLRGSFFVLPRKGSTVYFFQAQYSRQKLQWLAANGFELGNHTVHHLPGMKSWPDQRVEKEFAVAAKMIDDNVPNYKVDLLALPFGIYPRHIALVEKGSYFNLTYSNICALMAGAGPAPSPVTRSWNPYRVPRIIPGIGRFEISWWLDYLKAHRSQVYVSDGDPNTVTVPATMAKAVVPEKIEKLGLKLRTY